MALFGSARDASLIRSINRELINEFIDIEIAFYKLSLEDTRANMYDEADNKVIDGYNRKIMLKKAVIDQDRIEDLWLDNPDLIKAIEELWSGFPTLEKR